MARNVHVLDGIKIIDFSRILAAPFASMILGDLGAEVWKIEKPGKLKKRNKNYNTNGWVLRKTTIK